MKSDKKVKDDWFYATKRVGGSVMNFDRDVDNPVAKKTKTRKEKMSEFKWKDAKEYPPPEDGSFFMAFLGYELHSFQQVVVLRYDAEYSDFVALCECNETGVWNGIEFWMPIPDQKFLKERYEG